MLPGPTSARANQEIFNQLMGLFEGVFANGLNQANRIGTPEGDYSYDPQMPLSAPFENAGLPAWASALLGGAFGVALPGPNDFVPAARAAGAVRDVVRGTDAATPMRVFRAETPTGAGPMAGVTGGVRYASVDPATARALAYPGTRVLEGTVHAAPGGYLDMVNPNFDPADLIQRLMPHLDMADPMVAQSLARVQAGEMDMVELFRDLAARYGADLGGIPARAGIDAVRYPANMGAVNRQTAAADEVAFYNQSAFSPQNVYTDEEFRVLYPRGR